jgi:hypothetical protein|tara:strand:- start:14214 stop:14897 length:684 start_codon:yes stop_codon:yes gene_type:complete
MPKIVIEPDIGVAFPLKESYIDLKERAATVCQTLDKLQKLGLTLEEITKEDKDLAAALAVAYAQDPATVSERCNNTRVAALSNGTMIMVNSILQEFGHSVAESAAELRYLVTNKLLLESENPDPRIRIRALELLGKISDVGLFAEKSEVTITHQSTADLRKKLRGKLDKLLGVEDAEDAVIIDQVEINIDAELGLTGNEMMAALQEKDSGFDEVMDTVEKREGKHRG